jgi:energy-coupling factor transport system permease protein
LSDFNYLENVIASQYMPLGSWIHLRDPRFKLVAYLLLITSLTITTHIRGLVTGITAVIILVVFSKTPWRYVWRGILTPLPFLVLLAILQLFITQHTASSIPLLKIIGVGIFKEGILAGIRLILRFSTLVALLTVSSVTLSTLEMINGLELLLKPLKILGIQTGAIVMAVQITFRSIPFLAINAEKIAKAQASRGAEWGNKKGNLFKQIRQIFPLLIPLFNDSLKQADTLADAMIARGFKENGIRTSMAEYQISVQDWLFLFYSISVSALIILIK